MEQWLESVYSDGTREFVSNPQPALGETVTVWLRMYEDAPVRHAFLRTVPNGGEELIPMERRRCAHGFAYYAAKLVMTERRMQYQFYLVCDSVIYYYTQKAITTYLPDQTYDFVLLTDYRQPEWVKSAVFYQIFPERFCNGDPANDVRPGEYCMDGHPTTHAASWEERPRPYREAFCVDFYGGDLAGVRQKIPYLKELGVTAVYLNPIFVAPSVHKYDCIDYFHVDPHFGGDEALAELSRALHENDMKLLLDISINHTGTAHRWFNRDGLFFDPSEGAYHNKNATERSYYFFEGDSDRYKCWAGVKSLPTLNYTSKELRRVIYEDGDSVLRKWLKPPYEIDGWRFDVADVFARNNEIQLAHEIWPQIRESIRQENDQAYILAEDWGDCAQYLQGDEWDSAMNYYGCGRVIRQFLGEPDLYHMRIEELRSVPYRLTAEDVEARVTEHLAKLPYVFWQNQFNLFDSHDTPRLHNNPKVDREEYRGAVMFLFLLPGAPSIYYGDEAEIDGWIPDNEGCRFPMPWGQPFQEKETYRLYQTLAQLKKTSRALTEGGMKFLYAKGRVIALARFCEDEAWVAVLSTDSRAERISLPLGSIGAVRPKGERDLFGRTLRWSAQSEREITFAAEPHQAYLFACEMR